MATTYKPTLATFEDALERDGRYKTGNVEVKLNALGMFEVRKNDTTRQYEDMRDAWRSI